MSRLISTDHVEVVAAALLGAADVDDGPTDEQRRIVQALATGLWQRPDLDVGALEPRGPEAVAGVLAGAERDRFHQVLVLLEMARHPLTTAQADRVEAYAAALGFGDDETALCRDLVGRGADVARADFARMLERDEPEIEEPSLRGLDPDDAAADAALAARLHAFADLPTDTLGRQFLAFYERNGLRLPGDDPRTPAVFVAHDMTHVICGYEPTGPGEIALGAMVLAMADTPAHWTSFLANLAVHEVGLVGHQGLVPTTATMARPGAPELVADAFRRGAACSADVSRVDHLALADRPLEQVRAELGVPPLGVRP